MLNRNLRLYIVFLSLNYMHVYSSDITPTKSHSTSSIHETGIIRSFLQKINALEKKSPLPFNALARLCEGMGAVGTVSVMGYGGYILITEKDPCALVIFPLSPLIYYTVKYCCAKPIRITGGACVLTKNWIFDVLKKVDNDGVPQ